MSPQSDFLRPTRGTHVLVWCALATTALALVFALADAWQAWQQRSAALASLQATLQRADDAAARASAVPRVGARAPASEPNLIGRPWREVFESIESVTPPGMRWLSIDLGVDAALRLEGLAVDTAQAAAVVARLQAMPAWRDVELQRLERADNGAAAGPRVVIAARRS